MIALAVVLFTIAQEPETPLRIAASSFASVEVHLNARRIGTRWFEEDASLSVPSRIVQDPKLSGPHRMGGKVCVLIVAPPGAAGRIGFEEVATRPIPP